MNVDNKATATRFLQAFGAGDAAALKTLVTADIKVVTKGSADISMTHDYDTIMRLCAAFPQITSSGGIRFEFLNLTAEDDRVAVEAKGFSTEITGKQYNNEYHFLIFFRDGKVCLMHEYLDTKLADAVLGKYLTAA